MTDKEVLEQQVEALEKLLQLKQAIIDELESKVQKLQNPLPLGGIGSGIPINVPSVWTTPVPSWQCTDGNPHQYPQVWNGIFPPACQKCGHHILGSGVISVTNGTTQGGTITGVSTSGYAQAVDPNSQLAAGSNNVGTVYTLSNNSAKR